MKQRRKRALTSGVTWAFKFLCSSVLHFLLQINPHTVCNRDPGLTQVSPAVAGSGSTQPSSTPVTTAANLQEHIEDAVCCPLVSLIVRVRPCLRRSKTPVSVHSIRRSGRLASKSMASNATSQAQRVLLKKLGFSIAATEEDAEVSNKFKLAFGGNMSASK